MRGRTARAWAGAAGLMLALGAVPAAAHADETGAAAAAPDGFASCDVGSTRITDVMAGENWAPRTPDKWEFPGDEIILAEAGVNPGGYRRPFECARSQVCACHSTAAIPAWSPAVTVPLG